MENLVFILCFKSSNFSFRLLFTSVEMDSSSFIQFDVPEYSNTVLSQLNELRLQGKLCDIIVHIQGQPFRAHKAVLAASSPYFRDHSALSTMSGLSISVIKNPNVFEQLLSFCYTGRMSLQLKDVVSFLTAASFLQMQCVIDKCTQILESIHSKISVGDVDSVTVGAEENSENRNGVKDSSYFANPIEISPPYCSQVRQSTAGSDLRMETIPGKTLRSRLQEEGHSDRGSSGSISEYEIQIEGDHEQGDLIVRESQIAEVKVKMEKSDRPSCSDSSSLGDDGYHTEMVDGEQVVAVNVGSYGSVLQHVYSFTHASSQATGVSETFGSLSNTSPSRSMLSCFRGGRARQKRVPAGHLHGDVQGFVQGADGESMVQVQSIVTDCEGAGNDGLWRSPSFTPSHSELCWAQAAASPGSGGAAVPGHRRCQRQPCHGHRLSPAGGPASAHGRNAGVSRACAVLGTELLHFIYNKCRSQ
ncbi:zinc finger and BTB domain-containing protein 34 isoform X3 [Cinclus cinclus]|uniref:zinc finger and BTB domain-containing protein 34 isoform X3 n=1 Tax=Cinclus cinclus TaxID=127875 RepID=UPI002E144D52